LGLFLFWKGGENLLIITDIYDNEEGFVGYKGLKRNRTKDGEKTLAFLAIPDVNNQHSYPLIQNESIVEFDGEKYRIKQLKEKSRGKVTFKEVVAIHTFFDLIDEHIYDVRNGSLTFANAAQFVLGPYGYTWDIIGTFYAKEWENFGDDNPIALFQEMMKRYKAEFTLNGTHVTFKNKIGNATDFQLRYNYNIKSIEKDSDSSNFSTYIRGFGKEGLEAEYISPLDEANGGPFKRKHAKPVRDEKYTTQAGLMERLQSEIPSTIPFSVTVDFLDLRRAGYPYDVPNEGDDMFVIHEPMNMDLEARIMEIDEEFTDGNPHPIKTNVTIANYRNNMTDKWIDFSKTQKTVNDIVEGNKKLPYNVLDDAVKRATEALQSAQTELEFVNGIIARSKDNPNFLVLLNSAGIGISTDGGQTFRQAITSQGVVTEVLTAGQINANNISVRGGGETDYSLIDSNGFFAKGTAFSVQRPDGYTLINNGIANFDFATDMHDPPFRDSGVNINGYWFTTASTVPVSGNYYSFKHTARYLKMQVAFYKTGAGNTGGIRIAKNGNVLLVGKSFTNGITDPVAIVGEVLTVDLGVPTGEVVSVYLQGYQDIANGNVYFRKIRAWLEG
jgi:phage minor structural protein